MVKSIFLESCDGERFAVERDVLRLANAINTMLIDLGLDDDSDAVMTDPIPLQNVNASTLKKVIDWLKHHRGDAIPADDPSDAQKERRTDDIPVWDQAFFRVDQGTLFELILAANYLEIRALLNNGCKTVANMIKGKSPEEIRHMFNIKNDFTPEEEEQIRRENQWCED
ncbi:hypothetical protein L596_017231 [Steinernema carpocapsae]|uniref:Skp1-related protein n=1 Tax=Steinernema carpocapsae TaxID=34508 RepID=A0A4U5N1T0_STECR|nr:hypothetical protein L596_017231 [Steinernema carpocapsae]